jgi:trk system potassium uptake protein TrkA
VRIIVIGAGDVGFHIAQILSQEDHDVVVIELREDLARRVSEALDVKVVLGSGSNPDVLQEAGIEECDMLVAVTDKDEVNMIACFIASSQAKIPTKIARVRDEAYTRAIEGMDKGVLDIDLCIHPEREAAETALKLIEYPGVREVVEFAESQLLLVGVTVRPDSPLAWRPLEQIRLEEAGDGKILIVALHRGSRLIIPRGKDRLEPGDEVFIITERERVFPILHAMGIETQPTRRVIIFGDSKVALYLAHGMEARSIAAKLICQDEQRCNRLVEEFQKLIVLHGEGMDQDLLLEENVQGVDYFISASEDEEANILVSLLAKRLGARRSMALVTRLSYTSLVCTIGVDVVLNPQMAAVNRILRYIRRGKILSVATMGEEQAEAIEVEALETSDLVNRPLKSIRFPKDAIIGAVVRDGQITIPHGESIIRPGDRVIIFAKRQAIPAVEKALMVKLEYF